MWGVPDAQARVSISIWAPKPGSAQQLARFNPKPATAHITVVAQTQLAAPAPAPPPPPMAAAGSSTGRLLRIVTVFSASGRVRLALVDRGGRTFVCRPAVVSAVMVGCETLLREAAAAESDAGEISVEATASEISQLKACDMLGSRTARCTLVQLEWAAGVVRSELDPAAAASVELLCARARFPGVKALPASLPTPEEDEDDEDEEVEEGREDDAGACAPSATIACTHLLPAQQFASYASRAQARPPTSCRCPI